MPSHFQKSITAGLLLFSSYVFASSADTQLSATRYNNFYIGADVGIASLVDNESTNTPQDSHRLSATGAVGGGFIGYDFTLREQLKLGLEGFINATDLNLSDNQNYAPTSSYKVSMSYSAGFRLIPGYELTPDTIGELILGYAYGKFNVSDNGNYGIINTHFSKSGFQYGLGLKTFIYKNFSVRADVLYTTYSSQTSDGVTTSTPASTQVYKNNLSTLEGNLALIYKL